MIKGLDKFKAHFAAYKDQYVLIGGSASSLLMEEAELGFRSTKDLDIVLCVEALNASFATAFWAFIKTGGYQTQQRSTGENIFYRFQKPADSSYPAMLELFSRAPDNVRLGDDSHLTPIPVDEAASSLSAILLNEDYYRLIQDMKRDLDSVSLVGPECLIPLKAMAWLDLTRRREAGEAVDNNDIRKHKNDVMRLSQLLVPDATIKTPEAVKQDMRAFVERVQDDPPDLKNLGIKRALNQVLADLAQIYMLQAEEAPAVE